LEDLDGLTENKSLCNISGELDSAGFECVIRRQLQFFVQRTLAASLEQIERLGPAPGSQQEHIGVIMFVLKLLVANMDEKLDLSSRSDETASGACKTDQKEKAINPGCNTTHEKLDEILGLLLARKTSEKKESDICLSDIPHNDEQNDVLAAEKSSAKCRPGRRARNRSDGQTILFDMERLASAQAAWKAPESSGFSQDIPISKESSVLPIMTGPADSSLHKIQARTHEPDRLGFRNGNAKGFVDNAGALKIYSLADRLDGYDISIPHKRQLQQQDKLYEMQQKQTMNRTGSKAEEDLCDMHPHAWLRSQTKHVQCYSDAISCTESQSASLNDKFCHSNDQYNMKLCKCENSSKSCLDYQSQHEIVKKSSKSARFNRSKKLSPVKHANKFRSRVNDNLEHEVTEIICSLAPSPKHKDHRVSEYSSKFNDTTAACSQVAADFSLLAPKASDSKQETLITPRKVHASSESKSWMNRKHTSDIFSDDVDCASALGSETKVQEKLQHEFRKRLEKSLQKSAIKSWKISKLPCEQEFKLACNRRRRTEICRDSKQKEELADATAQWIAAASALPTTTGPPPEF